jgi:hypothetical protein
MKLLNNKSQEIYIAHFHGRGIIDHIRTKGIPPFVLNVPIKNADSDRIQIITAATSYNIKDMILIKQLEDNNIPYINKVPTDLTRRDWYNLKKIPIILESLKETNKEYSLFLDARDVVIVKDLDLLVESFLMKKKKIIFNACVNNFPPDCHYDDFMDRSVMGAYKYCNSGVFMGKTVDLIPYFEYLNSIKDNIPNPMRDDQLIVRYALEQFKDDVGYDYECDLFQAYGFTFLVPVDKENQIYRAQ